MSVSWDRTRAEAMTTRQPVQVQVQLEIRWAAGTIRGRLAIEGDRPSDFYGWLELINALERTVNPCGA